MTEGEPGGIEFTDEELGTTPQKTREEAPKPRTRSVRRPAKGRERVSGRQAPSGRKRRPPAPTPEIPGPAETVRGILQIPATAVVMIGQRSGSVPLVADGATVIVHGPPLAQAIEEWAKVDPRVAAALEKLIVFGPASAVATALVLMGAQFYRNHDEASAPITAGLGAVSATEIITAAGLDVPVDVSGNGQVSADGSAPES